MSETLQVTFTDDPGLIVLTPINLRAALGALYWTDRILAEEVQGKVPRSDIQAFINKGVPLGATEESLIIEALSRLVEFEHPGSGHGVRLKPEAFHRVKGRCTHVIDRTKTLARSQ